MSPEAANLVFDFELAAGGTPGHRSVRYEERWDDLAEYIERLEVDAARYRWIVAQRAQFWPADPEQCNHIWLQLQDFEGKPKGPYKCELCGTPRP